jgi:hypothetical protein
VTGICDSCLIKNRALASKGKGREPYRHKNRKIFLIKEIFAKHINKKILKYSRFTPFKHVN